MFEQRLKLLQKSLIANKIDSLIVSDAVNIAYLTGYSNFSRHEREAYLFIAQSSAMLFTDWRYFEAVRNRLPKGIKVFLYTELYRKIRGSSPKMTGVEQNFTLFEFKKFKVETGLKFVLTESIIENMRAVKDSDEIKNIRSACRLTDKTFEMVRKVINVGVTEKEIAWKIEKFIKESGGELAFDSIVAFGPNSAMPHHQTSNKKLAKKDQFILLDFGAKVNGYCSDLTRTILTKNANRKAREIHKTVFEAQQKAIEFINTSDGGRLSLRSHDSSEVNASKIAKIANNCIASKGFEPIPHGLGHGIGLEVHEEPRLSPKSKTKLIKGNVFTIEPGIYVPGFGGVRIEDNFILTGSGIEQLTKSPVSMC
jgi:Xaa-Pro aminopeptidase